MKAYPLFFETIYKERLWGGDKLVALKEKKQSVAGIGESWEISAVKGEASIVASGALAGQSITQLIFDYGKDFLGVSVLERFGTTFPILIKYIDADKDLSIQVHPDDEQAPAGERGKTEMWYIMQADDDARLIMGYKEGTDQTEYQKHIEKGTLEQIVNYTPVSSGDAFFIKPGLVHAIGAGTFLAEIQQTSDITYRVYDFNRRGNDGKLRELHVDQATAVTDFTADNNASIAYDKEFNGQQKLAHCPYFKTDLIQGLSETEINPSTQQSFVILMNVGEDAIIECNGEEFAFAKASTTLLPAALEKVSIRATTGSLRILHVHL